MTRFFSICGVRQQHPHTALGGNLTQTSQVASPIINRRQINLVITRVQHNALIGLDGDRVSMRNRMGYGDELNGERSDNDSITIGHRLELHSIGKASLINPVSCNTKGEL